MVEKLKNSKKALTSTNRTKSCEKLQDDCGFVAQKLTVMICEGCLLLAFCLTLIWALNKYYEPARDRLKVIDLD